MDNTVQIGNKMIKFAVVRRDIKNIRLELDQNTLEIQIIIPKDDEIKDIQKFLMEKKVWIYKNYIRFEKINKEKEKYQLNKKRKIFLLGKEYILKIKIGKENKISLNEGYIIIFFTDKSEATRENTKSQLLKWYKNKAKIYIKSKFMKIIKKLDFEYNQVFIKDLKTRWGNCTPNKNISYNWKIIFTPPEVINYIILHEIVHLKESNHSAKFWSIIMQEYPKYQEHKEWLEKNEQKLLLSFL